MLTIILVVVGILLLVIGVSQRKRIVLLLNVKVNEALDSAQDNVATAKYKLKQLKEAKNKLIDQAGEVFAALGEQKASVSELEKDIEKALSDAKKAKYEDNESLAKTKLGLHIELKKQLELLNENVDGLEKRKAVLETVIAKTKGQIASYDIRTKSLSSRKSVNDVLKKTKLAGFDGENLDETIDSAEKEIKRDELKMDYLTEESMSEEEDYSADINQAFDELK